MSGMNFFRPPYEQAVPQQKPYSFIDDLMGGIGHMTNQAAQAQAQREDMMAKLFQMRDQMSPEQYAGFKQLYGDRFPDVFGLPHAVDLMNQPGQAPAPTAQPPSTQQIQAGAAALTGQPTPQAAPALPQPSIFGQPTPFPALAPVQAPTGSPAAPIDTDTEPVAPPRPVPSSLIASAGGDTATVKNPFAALPTLMDTTRDAQVKLANKPNPGLDLAAQKGAAMVNEKEKPNPLMSSTPMAGRDWALDRQGALAKADAALGKMDIGSLNALIRLATAGSADTRTQGGIVNNLQKNALGEASVLEKPMDAGIAAGSRASVAGKSEELDSLKTNLKSTETQLLALQAAADKDKDLVATKETKARRAVRQQQIDQLHTDLLRYRTAIDQRIGM